MKNYTVFKVCALLIVCASCNAQKKSSINGIWIPEKVNWKDGSFHTIYIYSDTAFLRVASTQSKGTKDSINFMVEPGFAIEAGNFTKQTDDNVSVLYRLIYRTIQIVGEKLPGDVLKGNINIQGSSEIVFNNEKYVRTRLYTKESRERLKGLSEKFLPNIYKEYNIRQ